MNLPPKLLIYHCVYLMGASTPPEIFMDDHKAVRRMKNGEISGLETLEAENENQNNEIYDRLMATPVLPDFQFVEPSDLETICVLSPKTHIQLKNPNSPSDWADKFYSAWLGRC